MITTIIGSLPRFDEDLEKSIKMAIDFQVKKGIDIISDGEQRTDMVSYMTDSMLGISSSDSGHYISDKIRPSTNIEKSSKILDFLKAREYVKEKGYSNGLKISVTGPVTFGFTVAMKKPGPYGNLRNLELYKDVAKIVNLIAKFIQSYDVRVQIDEPGVNAGFLAPELAEEALNIATEGLDRKLTSIHACGKVNERVLKMLGRVDNVNILSLEFAGTPNNIELLSKGFFEEASKKIGLGCMKVNVLSLEELTTQDQSLEVIRNVETRIGKSLIEYIHPNCGLRNTKPELVSTILENLVSVSKRI
ncbi:MAG: hypothetical protein RMI79_02385 [Nitrososphaerota archaeon]|nr:hypothetical protein [Nitrososphaerota archaeon]